MILNDTNDAQDLPIQPKGSFLIGVFITCMSFATIVTILTNALIIITHIFQGRVRTCLATRYLVSLAVADLFVGTLVMIPSIIKLCNSNHWALGVAFCKLWVTFDVAFCTASIYNLLSISFDRFYAIYFPIKYATERNALFVNLSILFSWLMGLVVSLPMHIHKEHFSNFSSLISGGDCMPPVDFLSSGYVIYSAILAFVLPTFILIVIYTLIATKMRVRQRGKVILAKKSLQDHKNIQQRVVIVSMSETETSDRNTSLDLDQAWNKSIKWNEGSLTRKADCNKLHQNQERKNINRKSSNINRAELKLRMEQANQTRITTMMIVIILTFLLCWLPFSVMFCLFPFHFQQDGGSGLSDWFVDRPYLVEIITWIAYSNSWLNPIIYTGMNKDIRTGIANILRIPSKYFENNWSTTN